MEGDDSEEVAVDETADVPICSGSVQEKSGSLDFSFKLKLGNKKIEE